MFSLEYSMLAEKSTAVSTSGVPSENDRKYRESESVAERRSRSAQRASYIDGARYLWVK